MRALTNRVGSPARSFWCWVLDGPKVFAFVALGLHCAIAFFVLPTLFEPAALAVAWCLPVTVLLTIAPSRVLVGDDGVQWTHFFPGLPARYLSYGQLDKIKLTPRGLVIVPHGSVEIVVQTVQVTGQAETIRAEVDLRAQEWLSQPVDEPVPMLSAANEPYRGGQDVSALLEVVASPQIQSELRVEAARLLASRADADADVRAMLLGLSAASAEPKLRATFARIARRMSRKTSP